MAIDPFPYVLLVIGLAMIAYGISDIVDEKRRQRALIDVLEHASSDIHPASKTLSLSSFRLHHILPDRGYVFIHAVSHDWRRARSSGLIRYASFVALGASLFAGLIAIYFFHSVLLAIGIVVTLFFTSMHIYCQYKLEQLDDMIVKSLPDSVDALIRCLKSGFDLNRSMTIIAAEAAPVLRSEFQFLIRSRDLGQSLGDAMFAIAGRLHNSEVLYLATLIAVQERSGGPLVEALTGLSQILRDRERLRQRRIVASAEARMSALILGGLPVFIAALLFGTNPSYRDILLTTLSGRAFLALSVVLLLIGSLVMYRMIRTEIR